MQHGFRKRTHSQTVKIDQYAKKAAQQPWQHDCANGKTTVVV